MSGINFFSDNYVDNAVMSITTGAENTQFPLGNLQNESPSNKFRSTGNTVVIQLDLSTTRTIDTIAVVGDPTGTFGVTAMSVNTSVTTDFSLSTANAISLSSEHNIGYSFITSVSHRFVEITLTGTGSYSEMSNIFVGEKINLSQNSLSLGTFRYGYKDKSTIRRNRYGQSFIDTRNLQKFLAGTLEYCTKDEQEELDDMFIRHSRNKPIWMVIDPDSEAINEGQFKLATYGYLEESPRWSATGGQTYNAALRILGAV